MHFDSHFLFKSIHGIGLEGLGPFHSTFLRFQWQISFETPHPAWKQLFHMCFKILGAKGVSEALCSPSLPRARTQYGLIRTWKLRPVLFSPATCWLFSSSCFSRTLVVCTQDNTFPGGLCHPQCPGGNTAYKGKAWMTSSGSY